MLLRSVRFRARCGFAGVISGGVRAGGLLLLALSFARGLLGLTHLLLLRSGLRRLLAPRVLAGRLLLLLAGARLFLLRLLLSPLRLGLLLATLLLRPLLLGALFIRPLLAGLLLLLLLLSLPTTLVRLLLARIGLLLTLIRLLLALRGDPALLCLPLTLLDLAYARRLIAIRLLLVAGVGLRIGLLLADLLLAITLFKNLSPPILLQAFALQVAGAVLFEDDLLGPRPKTRRRITAIIAITPGAPVGVVADGANPGLSSRLNARRAGAPDLLPDWRAIARRAAQISAVGVIAAGKRRCAAELIAVKVATVAVEQGDQHSGGVEAIAVLAVTHEVRPRRVGLIIVIDLLVAIGVGVHRPVVLGLPGHALATVVVEAVGRRRIIERFLQPIGPLRQLIAGALRDRRDTRRRRRGQSRDGFIAAERFQWPGGGLLGLIAARRQGHSEKARTQDERGLQTSAGHGSHLAVIGRWSASSATCAAQIGPAVKPTVRYG